MAPSDSILLQSILDRLGALDSKVESIAERQAVIGERLDSHIARPSTPVKDDSKGIVANIFGVLKTWVLPIILAVFLLGRQSVEIQHVPLKQYPPTAIIGSASDDTEVLKRNKKIDSILLSKIVKP